MMKTIKTVAITMAIFICVMVAGALVVLFSGLYNIAADQPHIVLARLMLEAGKIRSVQFRGNREHAPNLRDRSREKQGTTLYRRDCRVCHGAPGVAEDQIGDGITPKPPPLAVAVKEWTDSELFWIVSHGLKMSGMPAFDARLTDAERWAIVAFLRRMVFLSPNEYRQFVIAADSGGKNDNIVWVENGDYGFSRLHKEGNAARGAHLLVRYGCATCHIIANLGQGRAGPPLADFAERHYLPGGLVNVPVNLVAWIQNPQRFVPNSAMPNLGIKEDEALDITAFLYTMGRHKRLDSLEKLANRHK